MKNTLISIAPGVAVTGATGDIKPSIVSAALTLLIELIRLFRKRKTEKKK